MMHNREIKIFIVDDDKLLRNAVKNQIRSHFSEYNIQVLPFYAGEQLECMIENQPDIAIVDYDFSLTPQSCMNGINIIDLLKKHSPETEIILFTGEDNTRLAVEALDHGAHDYVVKNELMFHRLNVAMLRCIKLRELKLQLRRQKQRGAIALFVIGLLLGIATLIQLFAPQLLRGHGFA
jgi:DNA-binding NtrC family response regulator